MTPDQLAFDFAREVADFALSGAVCLGTPQHDGQMYAPFAARWKGSACYHTPGPTPPMTKRPNRGQYRGLVERLVPLAAALLDILPTGVSVTHLRKIAGDLGYLSPAELHDRKALSCLGQVFKKAGAERIGTSKSTLPIAHGARQAVWAPRSPYKAP